MYIRQVKKQRSKDSKIFYQYSLAQTYRIEGKVKQKALLYLGAEPLMADKNNRNTVLQLLKAKIFGQKSLFSSKADDVLIKLALSYYEKYCIKYGKDNVGAASIPPSPQKADYHNIDIEGLEAKEVQTFGAEHLCKQVIDKLQLKECLTNLGFSSKKNELALISIVARALFTSSDHKTAQILNTHSSLTACFNVQKPIDHRELYAISDQLYAHKDKIDAFLYKRITSLFDLQDKLVIFDISNTYFETRKENCSLAQYGRSKEKRADCPLVVFTGVINAQGFIRHSKIYQGNKADVTTLEDMLNDLEQHAKPSVKQTVVLDAGIASEENLALIDSKGYHYVWVSRQRLKDYPIIEHDNEQDECIKAYTQRGNESVKLKTFNPPGYKDTWMYVQSQAKRRKEQSMDVKLQANYEQELANIEAALHKKGGTKLIEKVWERIGRAKERNRRVAAQYDIEVKNQQGKAVSMKWNKKKMIPSKKDKSEGVYFIRTSYKNACEKEIWQIYNTIREVESTFRCLKSDLQIRPIHHQNKERIEAHIYLTLLAYQLVNTIRYMLKAKGICHDWKNIVRIMNTQIIQTIILPTDKKTIHLRKPSKPIQEVQKIYKATHTTETQKAIKKYVVYH